MIGVKKKNHQSTAALNSIQTFRGDGILHSNRESGFEADFMD
jgi:hypothetical protein